VSTANLTKVRPVAQAIVRVSGLTKQFAVRRSWPELLRAPLRKAVRTTVVNGVSFEVAQGEFFGLLGANGAGKTTLFKMLATQLLPDSGSASIAGADVTSQPAAVRQLLTPVGADERSLNWRLTARQNLQLFAALYGLRGSQAAARIDELLHLVELHETGHKLVGTFSSGMKQRLLIARALLSRPRVLLLDEPTRSLDPVSARRFRRFLREEVGNRQNCTVLLATHNADEALELCDTVAVLDRGRLLATGTAQELMRQVSDDRYQVTVRERQLDALNFALGALAESDLRVLEERADSPGWVRLEVRIPHGADAAAQLLGKLTRTGIDVAHFERVNLSLADLLERIVRKEQQHA
jgi:ABC-2 type transport system ATP-binding protein